MSLYLDKLKIKNFRAIEELEIDFSRGINLIIGDNGMGKTSVIEAVKVALGTYILGVVGQSAPGIRQKDIRIEGVVDNGNIYHTPVEVSGTISLDDHEYTFVRYRNGEDSTFKTMSTVNGLSTAVAALMNTQGVILPVLYYRSDELVFADKKKEIKYDDRRVGYHSCLDGVCDKKEILDWCLAKELDQFHHKRDMKDYKLFKAMCGEFMKNTENAEVAPKLYYSRGKMDLVLFEKGKELSIDYLSSGYRTLLWTLMDIVHRIAILNPQLENYSEVPGVVVIDEIDTHLHAKWQWNILNVLQEMFPKVQFIIATHSPMVISSVRNASIIRVDNSSEINYLEDAFAYTVGDVLEFRLGSGEIPGELERAYSIFELALNRGDMKEAREAYLRMKDNYGMDNSMVKNAAFELEISGEE